MKILFTTQALTIGGIEVLALRLSEAFGKAGHDVILYDFNPEWSTGNGLADQYDRKHFRIASFLPPPVLNWTTWKIQAVLAKTGMNRNFRPGLVERHFSALLKRERPDVICSLTFHQDFISCRYAHPLGIPVVVSMHGTYEYAAPEWQEKARYIHDHVSAIIYAADKNMSWYGAQDYFNPDIPTFKVYTGTDLETPIPMTIRREDLGLSQDDFVFILVARGIREKGWQEALEAFRQVHARHPHTALLLVGSGEYLTDFRAANGDEPGVIFYGSHPNSVELTTLADVGLLPSYFPIETLPNVIVDYLRCSLPVIASDIGEILAMLTLPDGMVAGSILPRIGPGGTVPVAALEQAMEALVSDPADYKEQAARARQAARKFDIRDCVARYTEVFQQVLQQAQATGPER